MKINAVGTQVVIGKRVTIGAALNSVVLILAFYFPEHQQALLASAIPVTFLLQIFIAHKYGITT